MFSIVLFLFMLTFVSCEDLDRHNSSPAISVEFKINVEGKKQECFWQEVESNSTVRFAMQVLKGGDRKAAMTVWNPQDELVLTSQWNITARYEANVIEGGHFKVCVDNMSFRSKLVQFGFVTLRYDLWQEYAQELREMNIVAKNFTESIQNVSRNIFKMRSYQISLRGRATRDLLLMRDNNSYIKRWSIAQCVAILLTSIGQVYIVRKFFASPKTKLTLRP